MKREKLLYRVLITAITVLGVFGVGCRKPVTDTPSFPESLSLFVGEEVHLRVWVDFDNATNKKVSWKSLDKNIVTVKSGIVKAIAEGETSIIITTDNGRFQRSCLVTVSNEAPYGKRLLPSKIVKTDNIHSTTYKYIYDSQNRLTEIQAHENNTFYRKAAITYSTSGRIIEIEEANNIGDIYHTTFTYKGSYVTETCMETNERSIYELNDKGQCACMYYEDTDRKNLITAFRYTPQGNCCYITFFKERPDQNPNTTSVKYDHKNGISSCINMPPWFLLMWGIEDRLSFHHANNVVLLDDTPYCDTYSYVYNDDDYPSEIVINRNYRTAPDETVSAEASIRRRTSASNTSTHTHYAIEYVEAK